MNNRIKELAEQATEYNEQTLTGWLNPEKFAELIVQECAQVAADHEALDIYEEIGRAHV